MKLKYFVFSILFSLQCTTIIAQLQEKDIQDIAVLYNFDQPLFFKTLKGGIVNTPTYVYAQKNGKEVSLGVFKREKMSEIFTNTRFMFLEEMKNMGFKHLSAPIKNIYGQYLTEFHGKKYSCLEYIKPDEEETAISFAKMLEFIGKFHNASKNLPNSQILKFDKVQEYKSRQHFFSDEALKKCDQNLFLSSFWKEITLLNDFYTSDEFEKIYHSLPSQIVHGDTHYNNIIMSNHLFHFVDFDMVHYGARLWDLSCCILFNFCDEYLEKMQNGTIFAFLESNYGMKLEDIERQYLMEIVKFREMEVMGCLLMLMKEALIKDDRNKFEGHKETLVKEMTRLKKILVLD